MSGELWLGTSGGEPFFYKSKNLTTHALIIGMTGSGKTGLGITLLEEICLKNIPGFVIDPKGDMGNLCLALKNTDEFLAYTNDKSRAENLANSLRLGLNDDLERVSEFKNSVDFTIYTPKSSNGVGVALLGDFVPPQNLDDETMINYVNSLTSSILSLLSINADDSSKEHILISKILSNAFEKGKTLSLSELILAINEPPFSQIGVFDIEKFYPANERFKLSVKLNSLIASANFKAYTNGERLNIKNMLFNGTKAKCNIFSIAHLNDNERMFFVTFLLNEILAWIRTTSGTDELKAVLYMDEIFGYFSPNANPPSKTPMLTLLKQARAFGLGCVLSTQNPVDLDYKGLSNIGTWFIGRLITAQDKERVISGLNGDKTELFSQISNLEKRQFLVKNIHDDALKILNTRYALSYLKGPLTADEIKNLMSQKRQNFSHKDEQNQRPLISNEIKQLFASDKNELNAYFLGTARVRFYDTKFNIDTNLDLSFLGEACENFSWDNASKNPELNFTQMPQNATFMPLPSEILRLKNTKNLQSDLRDFIYQNEGLYLYVSPSLNSNPGESKEQFLARLSLNNSSKEQEALEQKFKAQRIRLEDKLARARQRLVKEQNDAKTSTIDAVVNIGASLIGAFFGKKSVSKIATSVKSTNRLLKERNDVKLSEAGVDEILAQIDDLEREFELKLAEIKSKNLEINQIKIAPKKSDIFIQDVVLVWM